MGSMHRHARAALTLVRRLGVLWLASCAACSREASPPRPNVLVVVVDTLRADRLSPYGYSKDTSPFLQGLAEDGLVFENAVAPSSWTAPATASIFTSLLPEQHGVWMGLNRFKSNRRSGAEVELNRIPSSVRTLPEVVQAAGYRTFAVTDNPNLIAEEGFARGFDRFHNEGYAGAPAVNAVALGWKDELRANEPWFLYLHYMDPHSPYHEREPWFDLEERELEGRSRTGVPLGHVPPRGLGMPDLVDFLAAVPDEGRDEYLAYVSDLFDAAYDSEVRYVDEHLRELFRELEIADDTFVIVTADHGELLGEHGHLGHPFTLFQELLHVPLIVRTGISSGPRGRVSERVSTLDVLPTLRRALDLPARERDQGRDLLATAVASAEEPRPVYSTRLLEEPDALHRKRAVVVDHWKLIVSDDGRVELYDLAADPEEAENRASTEAERVRELREELSKLDALPVPTREFSDYEISEEDAARLEELGYAGDG